MGNIVVSEFITLDGVIEGPGQDPTFDRSGWAFQFARGPEGDQYKLQEIKAAGALLLGRVAYEGFAQAWPSMPKDEFGFAEKMNSMPKYVVSRTLERADWNNTTIVRGDIAEEVPKLKREVDGDILVNAGAQLAQGLIEHDLVDEYRLMLYPILLGAGKRLFADTSLTARLRLTDTVNAGDTIILTYQPVRTADQPAVAVAP
jgi:dihydrofolate reductase